MEINLPVEKSRKSSTIICLPYDLDKIYAFFCSRYGNIKYDDLLNMGYEEFIAKLNSIPKSEPLFDILKSRTIDIKKIKDKDERKYWVCKFTTKEIQPLGF